VGRQNFSGDIAINVPQARLQAEKMRHPTQREIRLLWIHGILHLLGYTDYEPKPRRRMFKRQNELLRRWEKKA
jgi:probable rRNA maturation factor